MRYFLGALVGCLCLAFVASAEKLTEKEGHYYEQRPRLGHFKEYPFIDLYKSYAAAFVQPNFPERPNDDFRNYLPSAEECLVFLRKFRIDEYNLREIEELIVLDACLGYLYESKYQETDSEVSSNVRENLQQYIDDPKLKDLYEKTSMDTISDESKECIGDLLLGAVRAKKQFSDVVCNNHWLHIFNTFAECQKELPSTFRDTDSYGSLIYSLVKVRGVSCFHNEINALNTAIRHKYVNNPFQRAGNAFSFSTLKKQAADRIWPAEVVELLSAVQGTKTQVNLREVSGFIRGIAQNQPNLKQRFLKNLADYADATIRPKANKETQKDPNGQARYNKQVVDKLCNFFRQSDSQGYYDYATPFVRMVKMLQYPEIFDISQDYFVKEVFLHSYESGPLYLSVSSCNLLTYTEGQIIPKHQNGPLAYKVVFKPDTSGMIQWPDAGFY